MIDHRLKTPDGRVLSVREDADPRGRPVLVHGGSPGSRVMFSHDVARARQRGIRLISYDRPGYGGSTRLEARAVGDCAHDVRTIAAGLGIEQLVVWGISGGGPHAIACAALLEDLVPAVAVLASPAPWGAPGLDYFDGMGELNAEDIRLLVSDPAAARAKCEEERAQMLAATPEELRQILESLLAPVDSAVLTCELAKHLLETARVGLDSGVEGWWDDDVCFLKPWGFELESITTPVLLRHGRQDRFVPFGHGEWLARHISSVQAELTDDDGHLTLTKRHLDSVHAWLLERLA